MGSGGMLAKTPIDERLAEIITPSVESLGYSLVRVRLMGGKRATLQIMAERVADGGMDVEDCATLSRQLSAVLDVEDPIADEYMLEVSSPGIDRPLTRRVDFDRWAGHEAKLELRDAIDGRKRFRGELKGLDGDSVVLALEGGEDARLPFEDLSDAKLVLTDALIAESLRASKTAGAAADGAEIDVHEVDEFEDGDDQPDLASDSDGADDASPNSNT